MFEMLDVYLECVFDEADQIHGNGNTIIHLEKLVSSPVNIIQKCNFLLHPSTFDKLGFISPLLQMKYKESHPASF